MSSLRILACSLMIAAAAAALLAGCSDDPAKPHTTPSPYLEQTSPENVLANLVTAYERREIAPYRALLYDSAAAGDAADSFIFHFWDQDVEQHRVASAYWGPASEIASTGAMFADSTVDEVEVLLTHAASYADTTAGYEGQQIILVTNASLSVSVRLPGSSDPLIYRVDSNLARFHFKVQSVDAHGHSLWRIVNWEDLGAPFGMKSGSAKTTWGKLKSLFSNK